MTTIYTVMKYTKECYTIHNKEFIEFLKFFKVKQKAKDFVKDYEIPNRRYNYIVNSKTDDLTWIHDEDVSEFVNPLGISKVIVKNEISNLFIKENGKYDYLTRYDNGMTKAKTYVIIFKEYEIPNDLNNSENDVAAYIINNLFDIDEIRKLADVYSVSDKIMKAKNKFAKSLNCDRDAITTDTNNGKVTFSFDVNLLNEKGELV